MRLSQVLNDAVARPPIKANSPLIIQPIDPEEDWELAARVEHISQRVQIRSSRNKDVRLVAMVGDEVVGGVFDEMHEEPRARYLDDESDESGETIRICSFDVVVAPEWQGYQSVGLELIKSAIEQAASNDAQLIDLYVVNRRLIPVLCDKFGFEGEWGSGPAKLYKWL